MRNIRWLTILSIAAISVLLTPAAHADTITTYTLNIQNCSSGCGSGPFGTVTLDQVDANDVKVTFALQDANVFAISGAADPFGFNLDKTFTASTVVASSGKSFTLAGSDSFSGEGTFSSIVKCSNCGGGTSGMVGGSITFTLTNAGGLSAADFVADGSGYFFGADTGTVVSGNVSGTGPVGSEGPGSTIATPEPSTDVLLTAGLIGLIALAGLRRKHNPQMPA